MASDSTTTSSNWHAGQLTDCASRSTVSDDSAICLLKNGILLTTRGRMQTTVITAPSGSKIASRIQLLFLATAAASSVLIWSQFAPRYFYQTSILDRHRPHAVWLFLHILTASSALFTGPFMLWSGF